MQDKLPQVTVSSHFVRALLRPCRRQGVAIEPLLSDCGIAIEVLQEPQARVSGAAYTQLVQKVWQQLQDEFMGFTDSRSRLGTFAILCQLIIHCQTLGGALRRGERFYRLFDKPVVLHLEDDRSSALATLKLEIEPQLDDPDHFFQESLLVIWHRFASWLIGEPLRLHAVEFNYAEPAHRAEYRKLFDAPLRFASAATQMQFSRHYLDQRICQNERTLHNFLRDSPAILLAQPDDGNTWAGRIRRILFQAGVRQLPDFECVADQLNTSPQTLRRRLRQEQTSFQEIKDQLRRDTAIHFLRQPDRPINDIAIEVGFTEPSTFHRAFKKWTGLTPGEYRSEPFGPHSKP